MTRVVSGIEIEQNLVTISGSVEVSDEQATKPREVFSLGFDALDELGEGEDVDGQLALGDPEAPSDAA